MFLDRLHARMIVSVLVLGLILVANPASASTMGVQWLKRPGVTQVQVFVVDHTNSHYPVDKAAGAWNTPEIAFVHATSCPAYRACVNVNYSYDLPYPVVGYTNVYLFNKVIYHAEIKVTGYASAIPASERLAIVCHELGHALGLGHDAPGSPSCMVPDQYIGSVNTPSAADLSELASIYG